MRSAPVLRVTGVVAAAGPRRLLGPVGVAVRRGERVVVLGGSGSGKSTLALALLGQSALGVELTGHVRLDEVDLLALDEQGRRRARAGRIGYVPQHPATALDPVRRIGSVLRELARRRHRARAAREVAVRRACEQARIEDPELRRRFPHQLSGGQQQRMALALSLVTGPDVLVLDEPTTGLDARTRTELVDGLVAVAAAGTAVVLTTHDHDVARRLGGTALVLDAGQVVGHGPVEELLGAAPPRRHRPGRPASAAPRLVVRDLRIAARGRELLCGVDLAAAAGELVAVVGASGSGKTTLGRCLAGLAPGRGAVVVDGELLPPAVGSRSPAQRRAVQYVHQDPRSTFREHRTVVDQLVRAAVLLRGEEPAAARVAADALLERLGLDRELGSRRPRALSGGQLQRAALVRALLSRPAVLVCDEVTSALDPARRADVLRLLTQVRAVQDTTIVMINHDVGVVERVADRVLTMADGHLLDATPRRPGAAAGTTPDRRACPAPSAAAGAPRRAPAR